MWGKVAETCKKYLKKGSGVVASGDLEIELYEKDGETRVAVRLVNAQVEFTDRAPAKEQSANNLPGLSDLLDKFGKSCKNQRDGEHKKKC